MVASMGAQAGAMAIQDVTNAASTLFTAGVEAVNTMSETVSQAAASTMESAKASTQAINAAQRS
jgi:hypothetical protein